MFQDEVTVYKGNHILSASTDADGAVALGNENLFQSFIICSEYSTAKDVNGFDTRTIKLTYGKISAGMNDLI